MDAEVAKFIAQAAISVGGAFLAAFLAGRRFRTEKWWERKATAYSELVEALHIMKWPSSEHIDAEMEHRKIPEKEAEEQWDQFKMARRNVWRIADTSAFLVSPQVLEAVQQLERDLSKATSAVSYWEHLDTEHKAVQQCLDKIKALGRKELGIEDV